MREPITAKKKKNKKRVKKIKTIFITATNTNIGKTFVTKLLIKNLSKKGFRVGVFKPIETGVEDSPLDGNELLNEVYQYNEDFIHGICEVVPYQFKLPASPFVANIADNNNKNIDLNILKNHIKRFENSCDILLIEGAGGLLVPITKDFFMIDLIKFFEIDKTLLVTPSKLGSINDTLLSIEVLKNRNINFEWCVNLYEDKESFFEVTYPFYEDCFKDVIILDRDIKKLINLLKL